MNSNYKIYVVTHKDFNYPLISDYIPIQVGKLFTGTKLPFISDDTGENIAHRNDNYCELTALYWIWKNEELPDYIGIVHYRRYFVYGLTSKLLDKKRMDKIFNEYDIILPEKFVTKKNVYNHYITSDSGRENDLINLRNTIKKLYPSYLDDYDKVMNLKKASYCNMMVMSKEDFGNYCEWLFNILFELEKITDLTGYSKQEQRIYGFLSEFLLNVWVIHNDLKIKHCSMYYIEDNKFKNTFKKIKRGLRSVVYDR